MNTNMNFFVVAFVLSVTLVLGQNNPRFEEYFRGSGQKCRPYSGADEDNLNTLLQFGKLTTKTQACLAYCTLNSAGLQNGTDYDVEKGVELYKYIYEQDEKRFKSAEATVKMCVADDSFGVLSRV
ncbi:uncharacterized protein [Anabrus simplex]|uniref:uncharacterized protein isoform X2 n=1 Tax=Anabrus simplex TaxID=316456 RepID=UPI0035A3D4B6